MSVELLRDRRINDRWIAVYIKGYEDSKRIRPGHFEVWLANDSPEVGTLLINFVDEDGNEIPKARISRGYLKNKRRDCRNVPVISKRRPAITL